MSMFWPDTALWLAIGITILAIAWSLLARVAVLLRFGNRPSKQRVHCPKCRYDLSGALDDQGKAIRALICPECGHDAKSPQRLVAKRPPPFTTRRWPIAAMSLLMLAVIANAAFRYEQYETRGLWGMIPSPLLRIALPILPLQHDPTFLDDFDIVLIELAIRDDKPIELTAHLPLEHFHRQRLGPQGAHIDPGYATSFGRTWMKLSLNLITNSRVLEIDDQSRAKHNLLAELHDKGGDFDFEELDDWEWRWVVRRLCFERSETSANSLTVRNIGQETQGLSDYLHVSFTSPHWNRTSDSRIADTIREQHRPWTLPKTIEIPKHNAIIPITVKVTVGEWGNRQIHTRDFSLRYDAKRERFVIEDPAPSLDK